MNDQDRTDDTQPLASIVPQHVALEPLMHEIIRDPGRGMERLRAMIEGLDTIRGWAIEQTQPEDWVLHGEQVVPDSAACSLFRKAFGISVQATEAPMLEPQDDGSWTAIIIAEAVCGLTGERDLFIGERNSTEEFGGRVTGGKEARQSRSTGERKLTAVERGDLRKAALTNLKNTAARELSGIKRLPLPVLAERLGLPLDKVTARVRKGHGHGSAEERGAAKVAEPGVKEQAKELADQILRLTGGDKATAAGVLIDITRSIGKDGEPDGKFGGFKSSAQFTQSWQIKGAWERLRKHDLWDGGQEPEGRRPDAGDAASE